MEAQILVPYVVRFKKVTKYSLTLSRIFDFLNRNKKKNDVFKRQQPLKIWRQLKKCNRQNYLQNCKKMTILAIQEAVLWRVLNTLTIWPCCNWHNTGHTLEVYTPMRRLRTHTHIAKCYVKLSVSRRDKTRQDKTRHNKKKTMLF